MRFSRIVCLLLCLLLLAGCSAKADSPKPAESSGDMEKALQALKWEDYDTTLAEANAFLKRVPNSSRAKDVRETAAWSKLALLREWDFALSQGIVKKTYDGFSVTELPEDPDAEFQLVSYRVKTGRDANYFQQDVNFARIYVYEISLTWKYTNEAKEFTYTMEYPNDLRQSDISKKMLSQSHYGDELADEVHEKLAAYFQDTFVDSFNQVFEKIQQETGITPEELGFEAWNQ